MKEKLVTTLKNNLKNIYGWRTKRKIIVFSIDDYGNVRVDSKKARIAMDNAGLKIFSRFDVLDTLETTDDLSMLYETLTSVKDKNEKPAVFTAFALPCNIDFEAIASNKYSEFSNELLPKTFQRLENQQPEAYSGTWDLWKEGIDKGLMVPQFHGREHLNLKIFRKKLQDKSSDILTSLKHQSYTSIDDSAFPTMSFTAAFDFRTFEENDEHELIIKDGLDCFEKVFGYRATHFNSPGGGEHPIIHNYLLANGIRSLDTEFIKNQHQGEGVYKRLVNYTGKRNSLNMIYEVRNVVFEPTEQKGIDWVAYAMKQIETAFYWNRPAIISSHRVNFCGHLDENNRKIGIESLQLLLSKIVQQWPDVEFMASHELSELIAKDRS